MGILSWWRETKEDEVEKVKVRERFNFDGHEVTPIGYGSCYFTTVDGKNYLVAHIKVREEDYHVLKAKLGSISYVKDSNYGALLIDLYRDGEGYWAKICAKNFITYLLSTPWGLSIEMRFMEEHKSDSWRQRLAPQDNHASSELPFVI